MRRFLTAIALATVFAAPTLAGEVPSVGAPSPPPQGMTQTTNTTSPGDVPSGGYAEQISDAAVSGLLAMLGLLAL